MLTLRPYECEDAQMVASWVTDEKSFYQWCGGRLGDYPLSPAQLNASYHEFAAVPFFKVYVAQEDREPVGQFALRMVDFDRQDYRLCYVLVAPQKRNQGYGRKMLMLALDEAFRRLGAEKMTLAVFDNNPAAKRCYESLGFRDSGEALARKILGETWCALQYFMNHEDWKNDFLSVR